MLLLLRREGRSSISWCVRSARSLRLECWGNRQAGHPIAWSRVVVLQLRSRRLAAMAGRERVLARYLDTLIDPPAARSRAIHTSSRADRLDERRGDDPRGRGPRGVRGQAVHLSLQIRSAAVGQ